MGDTRQMVETGVRRSRTWKATAGTGVALLALVTIHMVAHHFVVEEVGGLRTYAQVLDYISNPVIFVLEMPVPGRGHDPRDARSPLGAVRLRTLGARQAPGGARPARAGDRDGRVRGDAHQRAGLEGLSPGPGHGRHRHRVAQPSHRGGRRRARPRDGRTGRAARDRRGPGPARPSDRHRRRAGDGGDRPGVVRRRRAGPDGSGERGALGGDGARPHAGGAPLRRPALRGADRGGSGGRRRHGEAGRAARAGRSGSPRRARREDRAPRGHRNRVVAGAIVGCGRRVIDHADREQPARAARAAGRQVRANRVVVRRPGHGARRDERPRTGRRRQLERRRHARCDAGSHDRGRRVGASGIRGAGGDRGARRARLRRSSRAPRTGACRSGVRLPGRVRDRARLSRVRRDRDRPRPAVPNARSRDPRGSRRRRGRVGRAGCRARCGRRRHRAPARARRGAGRRRRGGDLRRPSALPAGRRAPVPDQARDRRRWRLGRASLARRDRAHGEGLGRPRGRVPPGAGRRPPERRAPGARASARRPGPPPRARGTRRGDRERPVARRHRGARPCRRARDRHRRRRTHVARRGARARVGHPGRGRRRRCAARIWPRGPRSSWMGPPA